MITKEQIWYMFYVYPEYISQEEAKKEYNWRKNDGELNADESFLQSIANVINKINDNENDKKLSLNEIKNKISTLNRCDPVNIEFNYVMIRRDCGDYVNYNKLIELFS